MRVQLHVRTPGVKTRLLLLVVVVVVRGGASEHETGDSSSVVVIVVEAPVIKPTSIICRTGDISKDPREVSIIPIFSMLPVFHVANLCSFVSGLY